MLERDRSPGGRAGAAEEGGVEDGDGREWGLWLAGCGYGGEEEGLDGREEIAGKGVGVGVLL